ncbi:MAG: DUF2306 domain-containing protein [Betaproteobacteria bacterium]|nr:DUF2306 domain-containing protein [Betaproteobacteria bacterium]
MPLIKKALLYFLSLGVAAYAAIGYGITPLGSLVHPDMKEGFVAHPVGVLLHVFAAAIALALGPFQFSPHLRRTRRTLHRWMGRVYLGVGVLVGGLSGLYIAQFAFGGLVAKLGFAVLALCWLYTGLRAFLAIRSSAIDEHQKWMVRNFSLAFAAVMLRLYIPTSVLAGVDFAVAYPVIAWLCWLPNLLVAEWVYRTSHFRSPQRTAYNDR